MSTPTKVEGFFRVCFLRINVTQNDLFSEFGLENERLCRYLTEGGQMKMECLSLGLEKLFVVSSCQLDVRA